MTTTATKPTTQDEMVARLTKGQTWLTQTNALLCDQAHEWTPLRRRFADALELWGQLETALRILWGYEGCIHGPDGRCPDDAVVRCMACAGGAE